MTMKPNDSHRRTETAAVQHFKERGTILPGHQAEIARWIAANNRHGCERPSAAGDGGRRRGGA